METATAGPRIKYLRASWADDIRVAAVASTGVIPIRINDAYLPHMNRPERIQIWYGGSGSGKSDAKATELLLKCLLNPFFSSETRKRTFKQRQKAA